MNTTIYYLISKYYIQYCGLMEIFQIRKQSIRDLVTLCKDSKEYVQKVSFALAQLLQSDDSSEISLVHNCVGALFQIDTFGNFSVYKRVYKKFTRTCVINRFWS